MFWGKSKTNRYKVFNSWDNFVLPFPFSKGFYSFGNPIYVEKKMNEDEIKKATKNLQNEIKRLTELVYDKTNWFLSEIVNDTNHL